MEEVGRSSQKKLVSRVARKIKSKGGLGKKNSDLGKKNMRKKKENQNQGKKVPEDK